MYVATGGDKGCLDSGAWGQQGAESNQFDVPGAADFALSFQRYVVDTMVSARAREHPNFSDIDRHLGPCVSAIRFLDNGAVSILLSPSSLRSAASTWQLPFCKATFRAEPRKTVGIGQKTRALTRN